MFRDFYRNIILGLVEIAESGRKVYAGSSFPVGT